VNKQKEEISLNSFLSGYTNGLYEKVELVDAVTLQGYQLLTGEAQPNILGITPDKNYKVWETNKPADTSLNEL